MAKITIPETTVEKKTDKRSFPSAEKLEKLKLAREKAYAIRAEQRELKDKELLVKQLEREKREKEVNTKLKELIPIQPKPEPTEPIPAPKQKKKIVKQIVIESESDSDSDSEPVVIYRKVKKVKEPPKVIEEPEPPKVITEDHLSQSHINNEIKRLRREMARKSLFKAF